MIRNLVRCENIKIGKKAAVVKTRPDTCFCLHKRFDICIIVSAQTEKTAFVKWAFIMPRSKSGRIVILIEENTQSERQSFMLYGAMNSPLIPVLDEIETIASMGFDFFELTMDPPQAHYRQVCENRRHIQAALERHHLALVCHMPTFVSLADLTESIRQASLEEVLASLTAAAALQPLKIVLHPPYVSGLAVHVPELVNRYAFESLTAVIEKGLSLGLDLCLENMPPNAGFCTDVESMHTVLSRFPEIGLTLDVGHAHIGHTRSRSKRRWLKSFSDRLRHLHISDNHGKSDQHLPIEAGSVNFKKFIQHLKHIGYDQTLTLEIFSKDRTRLEKSKERFKQLWASIN